MKKEVEVTNLTEPRNIIEVEAVEPERKRHALTYRGMFAFMCLLNGYLASLLIHSSNILAIDKEDEGFFTVLFTLGISFLFYNVMMLIREVIGYKEKF